MGVLGGYGWLMGEWRSFESERKTSRMKLEKEVMDPQNPVARPMYIGMVFLTLPCRAFALCRLGSSFSAGRSEGSGRGSPRLPHSARNSFRSSDKKPITNVPATFAHSSEKLTGAPG